MIIVNYTERILDNPLTTNTWSSSKVFTHDDLAQRFIVTLWDNPKIVKYEVKFDGR